MCRNLTHSYMGTSLKFLQAVVRETLRYYPPAPSEVLWVSSNFQITWDLCCGGLGQIIVWSKLRGTVLVYVLCETDCRMNWMCNDDIGINGITHDWGTWFCCHFTSFIVVKSSILIRRSSTLTGWSSAKTYEFCLIRNCNRIYWSYWVVTHRCFYQTLPCASLSRHSNILLKQTTTPDFNSPK